MAKINGSRPFPEMPTRNPKVDVPLWALLVGLAGKILWHLLRWLARRPVSVAVVATIMMIHHRYGTAGLGVAAGGLVLVAAVWWRLHRRSFSWLAWWVVGRARLGLVYRRRWRPVMVHTGLAIREPTSTGDRVAFAETFPRIRRIRCTRWADRLRVELLYGQTPQQWAEQAEALRQAFRAQGCRVRADRRVGFVWVELIRRDPLARPILPADLDADGDGDHSDHGDSDPADVDAVTVGRREDGDPWRLPVRGTHVLVAGATGSGKGSVLWSVIRGLAPAVRAGLVELWVCDPKGGMELAFGEALFTRFAVDTAGIADLLDDAVTEMRNRAAELRGVSRLHAPTVGEPLIVVLVDEIASLTAYVTDRELKKRIGASLPLLLSQGRAPGVVVVAAVQDPRKEVLSFRDLFPVRVALRMTEPDQADLVLGDGAHDRGAVAEQIPTHLQGVGYVLADGQSDPVRVRASWVDDAEIARIAAVYRKPIVGQVVGIDPSTGDGWTPDATGWAA
ncbi:MULTISPECIES: FtsK/SpoIIIE domain-containing protein [Protofrankia]|uniref:FtsK/SpoIIIE domain-containing protein n=1 Tax=Protofrankia TaxID=2994361 RepID=UPI0006405DDF|nr:MULTISPECIES: FtsK/SpoIIIE domain-containing protein [Protofrankia]ONH35733.1 cell division protein FtsK [Protofrankia sp. BMG5.30]